MKKRAVSFILILLLALSLMPAPAFAATIVESGYCGIEADYKSVRWTLDSDGVLRISGNGRIGGDSLRGTNIYVNDSSTVKKAIISEGITGTDYGFMGFSNLSSITFPKSFTYIGSHAFLDTGFKSITIPDTVTTIFFRAFDNCESLTSISIPASLKKLDYNAFDSYYLKTIYYRGTESQWNTFVKNGGIVDSFDGSVQSEPSCNAEIVFTKTQQSTPSPSSNVKYIYTFYDVPETHKFARAIHWAVAHNIAWGTSKTSFDPEGTCTRGQVVTFLWRFKGQPEPTTNNNPFTDVKESDYFYKPVLWAVEQGITAGTTPTSFSPDAKCSYAHIGTFLWRVAGEVYPENQRYSSDLWYGDALSWEIDTFKNGFLWKNINPMANCPRGVVIQGIKDLDTYLDHLDDE